MLDGFGVKFFPGGGKYEGNWYFYIGEHGAQQAIYWMFDISFWPNECQGEIGTFKITQGWQSATGSADKIMNIWNPDASDDARGRQQHSVANAWELYTGEYGNFDNKSFP